MAKRIREKAAKRIENKDNRPYATARYEIGRAHV